MSIWWPTRSTTLIIDMHLLYDLDMVKTTDEQNLSRFPNIVTFSTFNYLKP